MQARLRPFLEDIMTLQHVLILCHSWPRPSDLSLTRTLLAKPTLKTLTLLTRTRRDYVVESMSTAWRNEPLSCGRVRLAWPSGCIVISSQTSTAAADSRTLGAVSPFWKPFELASREERVSIWHRIISFAQPNTGWAMYSYGRWNQSGAWFSPCIIDVRVAASTIIVSHELYVRFCMLEKADGSWLTNSATGSNDARAGCRHKNPNVTRTEKALRPSTS